ncbi:MAG: hypothetical protein QM755_15305 [Luteolibacter sp.]
MTISCLGLCHCKGPGPLPIGVGDVRASESGLVMARRIVRDGGIKMISHSGVIMGTDGDFILHLKRGGIVEMTELGIGPVGHTGTYTITRDGMVTLQMNGQRSNWPVMMVEQRAGKLYLYRRDGESFFPGSSSTVSGFWPLGEASR